MPVKVDLTPPPPSQSKQLGFPRTLLYNGSKFEGSQKCKGNSYAVEVVLQVMRTRHFTLVPNWQIKYYRISDNYASHLFLFPFYWHFQHVDEENSYLCGYLKITGLTFEYPMLTTFFDGEIISKKYPFLTRKWDADEDVDRKHWVSEADGCQHRWLTSNRRFWRV